MSQNLLRPEIKICGLTSFEDVDAAVRLGADYFGFIVYPRSPRAVTLERAVELAASLPEAKRVIVDVGTSPEALERYCAAGFGRFQIHVGLPLDLSHTAVLSEIVGVERLWLAPKIAPSDAFPEAALAHVRNFLLDTYAPGQSGGTGKTGDWTRFAAWRESYPEAHFILAGGLSPANILEALRATGARHVDVNSGVESAPGKKDPEKLEALFRVLSSVA